MSHDHAYQLPHPLTGQPFPSPVPPGSGWPEDPAPADAPVAHDAAAVRDLAATASDVDQLNGMASAVSYTHLTLPTTRLVCRSRWSPYH